MDQQRSCAVRAIDDFVRVGIGRVNDFVPESVVCGFLGVEVVEFGEACEEGVERVQVDAMRFSARNLTGFPICLLAFFGAVNAFTATGAQK